MTSRASIATPLLLAAVLACGPAPDQPVRDAFTRLLDGLDRVDAALLWELADDDTRRFFDDLAKEVREAAALVDAHWPDEQKAATRKAIGGDLVAAAASGAGLFAAVLDRNRQLAPADPDSRRVDRVELAGTVATVVLKSGESLEFRQDAQGGWRTPVFLAAFRDLPGAASLRDNLATVRNNAAILSASREPPAAPPGGTP